MNPHPLSEALARATLVHPRERLLAEIERMGAEITRDYAGRRPIFLTVMHGGQITGALLALAIGVDLEFDYLHATRYRSSTSGGALQWFRQPRVAMAGRDVLLVDDILDEGHTISAIRAHCEMQGARDVRVAVLCEKRHGRCLPGLKADYVGVEVPDRYVFGFGMDYYEQGRNLPAIYAV